MKTVLSFVLSILIGVVLAGGILLLSGPPQGSPVQLSPVTTPGLISVHISGAVMVPGVYQFSPGSRVSDGVQAAGGFLAMADRSAINLAVIMKDGDQVKVPEIISSKIATPATPGSQVNINTATLEDLDSLPGIGSTLAQRIISYREENGPFRRIEDLSNVSGIGLSLFDRIKDLITTGK